MGAVARGANKKEKYPKEGKENPKSEQNDRVHPGWVPGCTQPDVVFVGCCFCVLCNPCLLGEGHGLICGGQRCEPIFTLSVSQRVWGLFKMFD